MIEVKDKIAAGAVWLGIEFGSTRIKACLIDESTAPIAEGSHSWENRLENGIWTYSEEDIRSGLQSCYADLKRDVHEKYGTVPKKLMGIGISAMMHGYLAFDSQDRLLTPFRTWRNTVTAEAAGKLSALFGTNIPQRWSIAHLYQAILNGEDHVKEVASLNTLAGWVHYQLTGIRELGIGDASGMFPIKDGNYDQEMLDKFSALDEVKTSGLDIRKILPKAVKAGKGSAVLTEEGAGLLDPAGDLESGCKAAPPEGDAGTGMTATNSVRIGTGNVSAGTSIFSMMVLDRPLKGCYPQIDVVTTPDGADVAMVHCNNCCGELDKWVAMFAEFAKLSGHETDISKVYELLYTNAMNGSPDCGGITSYNYISGEPVTGVEKGSPAYFRSPDSPMRLSDFIRAELYGAMAALKAGNDILFGKEGVSPASFTGHGGLFKVRSAAQQILADALGSEVSVMSTAGEGGAWGMALLAAYNAENCEKSLADWLDDRVFSCMEKTTLKPSAKGQEGWNEYMERYKKGLDAQRLLGEI